MLFIDNNQRKNQYHLLYEIFRRASHNGFVDVELHPVLKKILYLFVYVCIVYVGVSKSDMWIKTGRKMNTGYR